MNKSNTIQKAEVLLKSLAIPHVPQDSEVEALIDQWLHAIATDSQLFCRKELASADNLKKEVIARLESEGVFTDRLDFFNQVFGGLELKPSANGSFKFIDLFAGIGGIRLPFDEIGGECVFSSEIDKFARQTYQANFGEEPNGDITLIEPNEIPKFDLLLAGFPCQPFSQAGLQKGFGDTRGTLFFYIAKIIEHHQPSVVLLENVKRLKTHDKGKTYRVMQETLESLGYKVTSQILAAKDFGIPQNRERIYIVALKDGTSFNFPKPTMQKTKVGDILETEVPEKYTISDRLWEGHQRRKREHKTKGNGFGYSLVNQESTHTNTISARYYKDGSEILVNQGNNKNPRKIIPREAARLQGFPDSYKIVVSDVQAYKQFGNSVCVPVVRAICHKLQPVLETISENF